MKIIFCLQHKANNDLMNNKKNIFIFFLYFKDLAPKKIFTVFHYGWKIQKRKIKKIKKIVVSKSNTHEKKRKIEEKSARKKSIKEL